MNFKILYCSLLLLIFIVLYVQRWLTVIHNPCVLIHVAFIIIWWLRFALIVIVRCATKNLDVFSMSFIHNFFVVVLSKFKHFEWWWIKLLACTLMLNHSCIQAWLGEDWHFLVSLIVSSVTTNTSQSSTYWKRCLIQTLRNVEPFRFRYVKVNTRWQFNDAVLLLIEDLHLMSFRLCEKCCFERSISLDLMTLVRWFFIWYYAQILFRFW